MSRNVVNLFAVVDEPTQGRVVVVEVPADETPMEYRVHERSEASGYVRRIRKVDLAIDPSFLARGSLLSISDISPHDALRRAKHVLDQRRKSTLRTLRDTEASIERLERSRTEEEETRNA